MSAITVEGLRKSYGHLEAVAGIDFTVERGEVFALLGPNGAGKTTTLEILEGFQDRDAGRVSVLGADPAQARHSRTLRERVGVVLQEAAVDPYLSVREVLSRTAGYYPHPRAVDEVIALVGLEEKAGARVRTLSGGQLRRLDVGMGIVGDPELVFLDEPTTGFDPTARRGAWDLVRALTGGGTTVVLTTHYMDEAQALADRVAILAAGVIVADGPPQTLGGRDTATARIRFRVPAGWSADQLPLPAVVTDGIAELLTTSDTQAPSEELRSLHILTGWALERQLPLEGLVVERPTLEDVYLRLTGGSP
ncbi:MAG TPA: ABC transporter ATP-binding protein [Mycobacteriales bacterium]|nr:ABC transporter ATP-binding protein [Mycobacteriales bacterium]